MRVKQYSQYLTFLPCKTLYVRTYIYLSHSKGTSHCIHTKRTHLNTHDDTIMYPTTSNACTRLN